MKVDFHLLLRFLRFELLLFFLILLITLDHELVAHLVLDQLGELLLLFSEAKLTLVGILLHRLHFFDGLLLAMALIVLLRTVHLLGFAFLQDTHCVQHVQAVVDATAQVLLLVGLLFLAVGAGARAVEQLRIVLVELRHNVSDLFVGSGTFVDHGFHHRLGDLFEARVFFIVYGLARRRLERIL